MLDTETSTLQCVVIDDKEFKINDYLHIPDKEHTTTYKVPIIDFPMMSDNKWMQSCLKSRLEHPEWYGEDAEKQIQKIKKWLKAHS